MRKNYQHTMLTVPRLGNPGVKNPSLGTSDTWLPGSVMLLTHCVARPHWISLFVSHLPKVAGLSSLCSPLQILPVPSSALTCNKLGCSRRAAATTGTNGGSNLRWPSGHKRSSRCLPPKRSWGLREALRAKACVPAVGTCPGHDSCHIPTGPEAGRTVRG